MIALYIILGIIFLIWLALFQFVTVDFSYLGGKLKVKVKYLFLTLFDLDEYKKKKELEENFDEDIDENSQSIKKAEKKSKHKYSNDDKGKEKSKDLKKSESKAQKKSEAENTAQKKKRKKTLEDKLFELGDKIEFIKQLYDIGKKPVFNILKGIHLTKLFIDFDIANEDAYDCAINFGRMNALVFNAVGNLACLFTVKKKSIDIHCVYDSTPAKYDASFYLRLRPTTVLAAGISFGVKYLIHFIIKPKFKAKKTNKKKSTPAVSS